jgi:dTMP kinase
MNKKGKFIVLEGQGFSGKTEQAHLLVKKLKKNGIEVIETQEPGGVESALEIREELLKKRKEGKITPDEEVELFYKSRERFLNELVLPALDMGTWVVSTRFSASTFVYQGFVDGLDIKKIEELEEKIVGDNQPDLYILIDVSEEEIWKRMDSSTREKHGYNEEDKEIIKKRREGYLKLAHENKHKNWEIIDGNEAIEKVSKNVWERVDKKLNVS